MKGSRMLALFPVAYAVACAPVKESVEVNVFHLDDLALIKKENPMMRAEQQNRLRGAVSLEERRERMGLYYHVRWDVSEQAVSAPLKVVFRYRQAATGSKVLTKTAEVGQEAKGLHEFQIIGDSYHQGGRVLSWKVDVFAGSQKLASEQSYMWQ